MKLTVLICRADGTQNLEEREFPDNWLEVAPSDTRQTKENTSQ